MVVGFHISIFFGLCGLAGIWSKHKMDVGWAAMFHGFWIVHRPIGPPWSVPNQWLPLLVKFLYTNLPKTSLSFFWADIVDTLERVFDCRLEIEPQVFLLRWIRLLFCREFDLQDGGLGLGSKWKEAEVESKTNDVEAVSHDREPSY